VTEPALPAKRTRKAPAGTATDSATTPTTRAKPAAKPAAKTATTAKPKGKAATKPKAATTAATPAKTSTAVPAVTPSADGLPHRGTPAPKPERAPLELARRIVDLAEDKKAADIVLLDLTALTTLADYFVICSGGSERQLAAIADGIVGGLRDERTRPIGREGTAASHWVLLDFGAVVVHIFTPPERDYYGLEKHWSEARTVIRVQ
jgi:ribosome-associated protein